MADLGIGALGYFGYAKESSEGTSTAPLKFLPATSITFQDGNEYLNPLTIRRGRDTSIAMPAPFIVSGTVEMPLVADDITMLLKSAFNANVSTSAYATVTGAYTHTFTLTDLPTSAYTFSAEYSTGGYASGTNTNDILVMRYLGTRVNTFEVRSAFGEIVTSTIGFDGISRARQTGSAATATYATNSVTPFHFTGASLTNSLNTNPSVQDLTFSVNNNIEHIGVLNATRSYSRVALGQREITLSMTCDFQGVDDYNALLNDTEASITLNFEGPVLVGGTTQKSKLSLTIPRVKYRTVDVPVNATDFITQSIEFQVLKPTSSQIITSMTLTNNEWGNGFGLGTW